MIEISLVAEKINEVKEEMKRVGLWATEAPAWVLHFGKTSITDGKDFCEWLQFIYLPNRKIDSVGKNEVYERNYIVPQAIKFFSNDIKKGKLLQLLIELDSLS
ncbi:MAG: YqcC family protein [Chitinophagaceae bacterium]